MHNLRSSGYVRTRQVSRFRRGKRGRFELACEALESRQLLSAASAASSSQLVAQTDLQATPLLTSGPTGYTPLQIRIAYGVNSTTFLGGTVIGYGAGQTIAIVTAYNDPNISSDLAAFDSTYRLPAPPSFTVANLGATTTDAGWALETSLDVEWAHTIAPAASIVLVEARSDSMTDLFSAVSYASHLPGVSVVSMSWGTNEFYGESAYDSIFTTPAGHTGVTFVAASGDSGAWSGPSYPSVSPNVLAVGGTSLTLASGAAYGTYGSETGWSGSTGGFSGYDSYWTSYESEPSYQAATLQSVGLSYGVRTTPDVSFNADPNTGVTVYDSVPYNGQSGWYQIGGTSAATPAWAGLIAIANQGLALGGKGTLTNTQALADLYALPSSSFHNITSGFNGYYATSGYNLVTGLGSPQANVVIAGILAENGVSAAPAVTRSAAPATGQSVGGTGSRFDLIAASTNSGSTFSTAGILSQGLGGGSATSSAAGIGALVTPTSSAQGAVLQTTVTTSALSASTSAAPSFGQSLPERPQITSTSVSTRDTTTPTWVDENAPAVAVPVLAQPQPQTPSEAGAKAVQDSPPASDLKMEGQPVQTPAEPEVPPAVIPPTLRATPEDEPKAALGLASDVQLAADVSSSPSLPSLAGAAVIAVGGYQVLLGRANRIKRQRIRFPFM
jgi:subtilase family serine protease